jgi:hypothetical protein
MEAVQSGRDANLVNRVEADSRLEPYRLETIGL